MRYESFKLLEHRGLAGVGGFWRSKCIGNDTILGSQTVKESNRWWVMLGSAVEAQRWSFANRGSEMREFHDLQTHLNCRRDLTGTLWRIFEISSSSKTGDA